jgi:hypothetical protein
MRTPDSFPELQRRFPQKRMALVKKSSVGEITGNLEIAEESAVNDLLNRVPRAESDYDFGWAQIPYGSGWNAARIDKLIKRLVSFGLLITVSPTTGS